MPAARISSLSHVPMGEGRVRALLFGGATVHSTVVRTLQSDDARTHPSRPIASSPEEVPVPPFPPSRYTPNEVTLRSPLPNPRAIEIDGHTGYVTDSAT